MSRTGRCAYGEGGALAAAAPSTTTDANPNDRERQGSPDHGIMNTISNLQTKPCETIERYRSELPGAETDGTGPNRPVSTGPDPRRETEPDTSRTESDGTDPAGARYPDDEPARDRQMTNGGNVTGDGTRRLDRSRPATGREAGTGDDTDTGVGTDADARPGTAEWRTAEPPTDKALYGVTATTAGPFAVGTDGLVLRRGRDGWQSVIESGPATRKNQLTAVDATDDGERIWFCGSSGALGAYDVGPAMKYDYSAPNEKTSTWEAIAVAGARNTERLRVANGSGEVLSVSIGDQGCPTWGTVVKPGSGSTIAALDFDGERCYAVDTSGNVFEQADETDDDWNDIGIENAQVNFADVLVTENHVLVAGGGGRVYRYDRPCESWTPIDAGEGALYALDDDGARTVTVGAGGGVYERLPRAGWCASDSPVEEDLRSITLGATGSTDRRTGVDVAVGENGTIVERSTGEVAK